MYRPLPRFLTVKASKIEGLGLFVTEDIDVNTNLGISHIEVDEVVYRTPLGGFYNHCDNPNIKRIVEGNKHYLITLTSVLAGTELCSNYNMYKVSK